MVNMITFLRAYWLFYDVKKSRKKGHYTLEILCKYKKLYELSSSINVKFSYFKFLRDIGRPLDKEGFFLSKIT